MKLLDFTPEEIEYLLDLAADLKDKKKKGIPVDTLRGKNVALIFEKTSTRTRCALKWQPMIWEWERLIWIPPDPRSAKGKHCRYCQSTGRHVRGYRISWLRTGYCGGTGKYSKVPVWNGLTNEFHPTQMLADLLTIREHFGHLKGIRMTYMGDARYNMGNSLMVACAKMGMHFTACTTAKYFPAKELVAECEAIAAQTGGSITLTEDVKAGTKDVDVIYTDVWVSMGERRSMDRAY